MARYPLALVGLLLAGCYIGRSAEQLPYATGPHGAAATLQCEHGATVAGELLLVQDTAVLVLREGRVVLVPFRLIRSGRFAATNFEILGGPAPDAKTLAQLRLVSRYPPGLTADQLQALLAASGQATPDAVNP